MKIKKPLLQDDVSIQVVKGDPDLVCRTCLHSGPARGGAVGEKTVYCHLNPDPREYVLIHFCAQGLWLIDEQVMGFKDAFTYLYQKRTAKENA